MSEAIPKDCYRGLWNQNHTASVRAALQKISHKFPVGRSYVCIALDKDDSANVYVKDFNISAKRTIPKSRIVAAAAQDQMEWEYPITFEIGKFKWESSIKTLTDEAIIPIPGIGNCVFEFYSGTMSYKFKRVM